MDVNGMWTVQSLEKEMQAVSRDQKIPEIWDVDSFDQKPVSWESQNSILTATYITLASWHQVIFFEKCEHLIKC